MYRFAAPTVLADATRLAAGGDGQSILIANVPGPREARQLLGRELLAVFPILPLTVSADSPRPPSRTAARSGWAHG